MVSLCSPHRGRRCGGLSDLHAGNRAGDDEALDLGRTLEDRVDLGVPVPALDRMIAQVAGTAQDLYGLLGHAYGDLARLELAHRTLAGLERALVAAHPGGPPDEQARRVDLGPHVGQRERDRLVLNDRPAELLARLGVVERIFVRRPGD